MKNTIILSNNKKVKFYDLPEGWFYKGNFGGDSFIFKLAEIDGYVNRRSFANGIFAYNDIVYGSLRELYDYNDFFTDENMSFSDFIKDYKTGTLPIYRNPRPCTLYNYNGYDGENALEDTKCAALMNMRNDLSNYRILETAENVEENYIERISDEECETYLKKSIKDRIAILENFVKGQIE